MAKFIDNPWIGRVLFLSALRGDLRRAVKKTASACARCEASYRENAARVAEAITHSIAAASMVFAATFTNVLLGTFLRRTLLFWLSGDDDEPQSAGIIVTDVASLKRGHEKAPPRRGQEPKP